MENFNEALKKVKSSVNMEDVKKYEEIEDTYIHTARSSGIREINYMG